MKKNNDNINESIFVVEDDDGLRVLILKMLKKAGYNAKGFALGYEAIEHIIAEMPAAVLLDQKLPDMTGRHVIDLLTERNITIPFIIMTGQGDERLAVEMMKLGATDYLIKDTDFLDILPVTVERLFNAIKKERALEQARESLQESEERFRFIVDNSYDLIWMMDAGSVISYASPSWETMLGYKPEYMNLKCYQQFVHPDDTAGYNRYLSDMISARKALPGKQYRVKHANGTWRWHESSMTPVYDKNSSLIYLVGVSRDITEHKLAEEKLIYERILLRTIIDSIPDAIYVKDTESRRILSNKADCEYAGYKNEEELLGKNDFDIFPRDLAQKQFDEDQLILSEGKRIVNQEEKIAKPNGDIVWLLTTKIPFLNENKTNIGIVGIARDITKRKQADEQLAALYYETNRINKLMRGRENRILELKTEVNKLARQLNMGVIYKSVEDML